MSWFGTKTKPKLKPVKPSIELDRTSRLVSGANGFFLLKKFENVLASPFSHGCAALID